MKKEQLKLESIRKEYFNKLLRSRRSIDDMMPLFTQAKNIFDIIKEGPRFRKRKRSKRKK